MASFESVRVAAIQATPVILDAAATIEKAERLLHEAADAGARLAVLPECFVSLYPSNAWARGASAFSGWDDAVDADVGGVGRRPRVRSSTGSSRSARSATCTARSASTSASPTAPARSTTRSRISAPRA